MATKSQFVAMLSHYLKELKTAIQCLGIKPKAINKMTPISKTLNVMAKLDQEERPTESQERQQFLVMQTATSLLAKTLIQNIVKHS